MGYRIADRCGMDPTTYEVAAHFVTIAAEAVSFGNHLSFWREILSSDLNEHDFVRQAVLAVSGLHRHRLQGTRPSQCTLKRQHDALIHLQSYQPHGHVDILAVLSAAVLLVWCEVGVFNSLRGLLKDTK